MLSDSIGREPRDDHMQATHLRASAPELARQIAAIEAVLNAT